MSWTDIVLKTLATTRVRSLLETKPALVFSRIARGGGATEWRYCSDASKLEALTARLRPGSVVSFYFDHRIRRAPRSGSLVAEIERIIAETGDAVVGVLEEDGIEIQTRLAISPVDLQEVLSELPPGDVFYGATPDRDNDGTHAVTVTLPDADGIVRPHPH